MCRAVSPQDPVQGPEEGVALLTKRSRVEVTAQQIIRCALKLEGGNALLAVALLHDEGIVWTADVSPPQHAICGRISWLTSIAGAQLAGRQGGIILCTAISFMRSNPACCVCAAGLRTMFPAVGRRACAERSWRLGRTAPSSRCAVTRCCSGSSWRP